MCQFFSVVSKGDGIPIYCDDVVRKSGDIGEPDSHTAIADYFGIKGLAQDRLNKYEYNPLTKKFTVDQLNTDDDSARMEKFCKELNFKRIVPELIIKPIVHPFKDRNAKRVTKKDIALLVKWDSVRDSVGDSVRYSVRDSMWGSVWDSVGVSVWDSMWGSVGDSVWGSVGDSMGGSVGDSVGDSMRDSVWGSVWVSMRYSVGDSVRDFVWYSVRDSVWYSVRGSVWGYTSSFFNIPKWKYVKHEKGKNPFQSGIDLWERGLVPNFDGNIWRLNGGKKGKVLFEIAKKDLGMCKE